MRNHRTISSERCVHWRNPSSRQAMLQARSGLQRNSPEYRREEPRRPPPVPGAGHRRCCHAGRARSWGERAHGRHDRGVDAPSCGRSDQGRRGANRGNRSRVASYGAPRQRPQSLSRERWCLRGGPLFLGHERTRTACGRDPPSHRARASRASKSGQATGRCDLRRD